MLNVTQGGVTPIVGNQCCPSAKIEFNVLYDRDFGGVVFIEIILNDGATIGVFQTWNTDFHGHHIIPVAADYAKAHKADGKEFAESAGDGSGRF